MDSLTSEEQNVLDQFREITNYDKETESTKVLRLLTVCNWNLETAIARYFDNDFPQLFDEIPSQSPLQPTSSIITDTTTNNFEHNINFTNNTNFDSITNNNNIFNTQIPIPPPPPPPLNTNRNDFMLPYPEDLFRAKLHRAFPISNKWKFQAGLLNSSKVNSNNSKLSKLLTPIVFLLMIMPKFLLLVGYGLNKLFGNFAPNLFRILGLRQEEDDFPAYPIHTSPEEISNYDIIEYINKISNNDNKDLPIFKGEFNKAFDEARDNLKWFCIILFNSESASTSKKLIDSFLTNQLFIDFINKNDIVLYVGDVSYPEAFEVSQTYSAFGLPYLSLIANVSPTGLTHPEFSFVCKYNKFISSSKSNSNGSSNELITSKLCRKLTRIVSKYEPQLIVQRYDKQEAQCSRLIREQQDSAYQESLLKDMEKEKEKQRIIEEENLKIEKEKEEELKVEIALQKHKEYIINYINNNYNENCENLKKGQFTTIQFRTNNGQRFIKKFSQTATAYDIFMFVASKQLIKEYIEDGEFGTEDDLLDYFKKYQFKFNNNNDKDVGINFSFDLISPMPRLKIEPNNTELCKIKEIWPNGSLLIEERDDDDYDDNDNEAEEDY